MKNEEFSFACHFSAFLSHILSYMRWLHEPTIAILLCRHASDALEVSVEGSGFREAKHISGFLKCLRGACLDETFGLCRHILLYPTDWR